MIRLPVSFDVSWRTAETQFDVVEDVLEEIIPPDEERGMVKVFFPNVMLRGDDALTHSWHYAIGGHNPFPNVPLMFRTPKVRVGWSFPLMEPYPGFSSFVSQEVLERGFVDSFDEDIRSRPEFNGAGFENWRALTYSLLDYFPAHSKGDASLEKIGRQQYRCARALLMFQDGKGLQGYEQMELLCIGNSIDNVIGDEFDVECGSRLHIVRYDRDHSVDYSYCVEMLKCSVLQEIQKVDKDCNALPRELVDKIDFLAHHFKTRIRMEALYFPPIKKSPPAKGSEA